MRRQKIIMGTGVSLDIPGAKSEKPFGEVFNLLKEIDARFSSYKSDSELSRYQRGELGKKELSAEMRSVQKACAKCEKFTDGYFSAYFNGKFDPTGYVKGWAISRAGELLEKNGHQTFCISIGGDVLARSNGSKEWAIGIQHPQESKKILNMLSIFNGAVATSGSYERGPHIINPKTGRPAEELLSVTVVGSDIIKADVLATAVLAAGKGLPGFIKRQKDYKFFVIDKEGSIL